MQPGERSSGPSAKKRAVAFANQGNASKKPKPPTSYGSVELDALAEYILSLGSLPLARGWRVETHVRDGTRYVDRYYFKPPGVKFRSRVEVARHFGLLDGAKEKSSPQAARRNSAPPVEISAEPVRCSRNDGDNWRCCEMAMLGHNPCQKDTLGAAKTHSNKRDEGLANLNSESKTHRKTPALSRVPSGRVTPPQTPAHAAQTVTLQRIHDFRDEKNGRK